MQKSFLFFFIFINFKIYAQESIACKEDLFPIRDEQKKQFGYVNIFGVWKIPAFYDSARSFKEGIAVVNRKSKFGIISCEGKVILTCEYEEIQDFVNGYSWIKKNGVWGLIDTKGKIILACNYSKVENISNFNDLAWLQTNSKWGVFDKINLKFIHNPQFDNYLQLSDKTSLIEVNGKKGMISHSKIEKILEPNEDSIIKFAPYLLSFYKNGKVGVIKDIGTKLLNQEFDEVMYLGSALFSAKKNNTYGVWDTWGKQLTPLFLDSIGSFSNNAAVYKKENVYGFVNTKGNPFIEKYEFANTFVNGIALVKQKNRSFLINRKGEIISQSFDQLKLYKEYFIGKEDLDDSWGIYTYENPQNSTNTFDSVLGGNCDKIKVKAKGKIWFYNAKLQELATNLSFDSIGDWQKILQTNDRFALIKENGKFGVIDTNLSVTISPTFEKISAYNSNQIFFFIGKKQNTEFLFARNGKEVLKNYTKINPISKNTFIVKKELKFGIVNDKSEIVIPFKYDNLTSESRENPSFYFPVCARIKTKYGLINQKGETVVDFKYDEINYIGNGYFSIIKKHQQSIVDGNAQLILKKMPYTVISSLTNDLFLVSKDNKFGIINKKNEQKTPLIYDAVYPYYGNFCVVKKESRFGIINRNGQLKHEIVYEKMKLLDTKVILMKENKKVELSTKGILTE